MAEVKELSQPLELVKRFYSAFGRCCYRAQTEPDVADRVIEAFCLTYLGLEGSDLLREELYDTFCELGPVGNEPIGTTRIDQLSPEGLEGKKLTEDGRIRLQVLLAQLETEYADQPDFPNPGAETAF